MPNAVVPFVLQPSFSWHGNDGNWSTFLVRVGSPPQSFYVLPSTVGGETWIPLPEGCSPYTFDNCGASRGVLPVDGSPSSGFKQNESTTWQEFGIYALGLEQNLFGLGDSGLYGLDTLSLGLQNGSFASIPDQPVAGIGTSNFWLGSLGLGIEPAVYDVEEQSVQTLLASLVNQSMATSRSYGYSAGAAYRGAGGGIVLGGFDQDAFTPSEVEFDLYFNGSRSLTASLRDVMVSNTLQGTRSMPIGQYNTVSIDSTVSQLWLPRTLCDALENYLGLEYNEPTGLYLVNETARAEMIMRSPEFTFTLAPDATTRRTMNIVLPYATFDQQIGLPVSENRTSYFPIRRAANESQFVLGRTFLQEAYLVTDWDRQTFTLGQSLHHNGVSNNIVPILPKKSSRLSTGTIVGIALGGAVGLIGCCILGWWFLRKKRRVTKASHEATGLVEHYPDDEKRADEIEGPHELAVSAQRTGAELETHERYELHEDQIKHQLMSQPIYELPGRTAEHELPGSSTEHELEGERSDMLPPRLFSPDTEPPAEESTAGQDTMDRFRRRFVV